MSRVMLACGSPKNASSWLEEARHRAEVWLEPSLCPFFTVELWRYHFVPLCLSVASEIYTVCPRHVVNPCSVNNFHVDTDRFELGHHAQSRHRAACGLSAPHAASTPSLSPRGTGSRRSFQTSEGGANLWVLLLASVCLPVDAHVCSRANICFRCVPAGAEPRVRSLSSAGASAASTTAIRIVLCGKIIYINFICTVLSLLYVR